MSTRRKLLFEARHRRQRSWTRAVSRTGFQSRGTAFDPYVATVALWLVGLLHSSFCVRLCCNGKEKDWLAQVQQEANTEAAKGSLVVPLSLNTPNLPNPLKSPSQFLRLQQLEKTEAGNRRPLFWLYGSGLSDSLVGTGGMEKEMETIVLLGYRSL